MLDSLKRFFSVSYIILLLSLPPIFGLFSGVYVKYRLLPKEMGAHYQFSFHLKSFYYSHSLWELRYQIDLPEETTSHYSEVLTLKHGPWLENAQWGLSAFSNKNESLKANCSFLLTLSYDMNISHNNKLPMTLQAYGSYNPLLYYHKGEIQGSFYWFNSYWSNTLIHFETQSNAWGSSAYAFSIESDSIQSLYNHPEWCVTGVSADFIPSLNSWRGSLISTVEMDSLMYNNQNFPSVAIDLSMIGAKSKRLVDYVKMIDSYLPWQSHDYSVLDPIKAEEFIDIMDVIDPQWAYFSLRSQENQWLFRVSDGGLSIQIDGEGNPHQLTALWNQFFPRPLIPDLPQSVIELAHSYPDVRLSCYNFQKLVLNPAIAPTPSMPLSDS